jgi:LysR family transcriptional regulator, nitrogen assimilation regulatory protein
VELRQLRYFLGVATHRSFSKASQKLHIAQPALSRQIHALEEELGVKLLTRTVRGVEVTDAGRKLQEMSEQVLGYIGDIRLKLNQAADEPSGSIILGLPPSLAYLLAPRLVEEARRRYPQLHLRIMEGLSVFLSEWLELGRIDLAVLTDLGPLPGVKRQEIAEEDMVFAGAPKLLPQGGKLALAEILGYPIVVTHGFRSILEPWLTAQNIEPHYEMELDSIPIVREMLLRGLYCSIVPYSMVHADVAAGQIVARTFHDPPIVRRIVAATINRRPDSLAVRATTELVGEEIAKLPKRLANNDPTTQTRLRLTKPARLLP